MQLNAEIKCQNAFCPYFFWSVNFVKCSKMRYFYMNAAHLLLNKLLCQTEERKELFGKKSMMNSFKTREKKKKRLTFGETVEQRTDQRNIDEWI